MNSSIEQIMIALAIAVGCGIVVALGFHFDFHVMILLGGIGFGGILSVVVSTLRDW